MKFIVINGSPKGELSLTMQYFRYFDKIYPELTFEVINVAQSIKKIENNKDKLNEIIEKIENSDGLFWGFGVYHFTVPSQLKRFIELLFPHKNKFKNKYCSYLTTSIHFYDTMAAEYITAISEDLGFNVIKGYLSNMHDLVKPKHKKMLNQFMNRVVFNIENKSVFTTRYPKIKKIKTRYIASELTSNKNSTKKDIVLIYDNFNKNSNLKEMVKKFENTLSNKIETINLAEINIKGGCLGCIHCGYEGKCVYKDDLIDLHTKRLIKADAIIIAGDIVDRYFSSRMKKFWDRSFLNGHRPMLKKKQFLYIISGDLKNNPILYQEIEARADVGEKNLVGVINDGDNSQKEIDNLINSYAKELIFNIEQATLTPKAFWGVSGHKIFRDFIYNSRGIFKEDHKYYTKNYHYDFPQRKRVERYINIALANALNIKKVRNKFNKEFKKIIIMPVKKDIDKL